MSHKEAKFVCEKCNVSMVTFASAAVWCSRGHRMEKEEPQNGKADKQLHNS